MREHDARLKRLKKQMLARYPCVRALTLGRLLSETTEVGPADVLRRWDRGQLIGMQGPGGPLFPEFQVDMAQGGIHDVVTRALAYFDSQEKASGRPVFLWFTTPRPYLDERVPADCLQNDGMEIIQALEYEDGVAGG